MTTSLTAPFTTFALGFPWRTRDPFLFCVHHLDRYPRGNRELGPAASLSDRRLGMDFEVKDGFRMYHGEVVPGFPAHPHRGFETVTLARQGMIDHSDSLGAKARFGHGDVQWMTAGRGIVHSEMFPLLDADRDNPVELFQIWLNLPAKNKMVEPHFSMLWSSSIPKVKVDGESEVTVVAGRFGEARAPSPPPDSWAADEAADVAIWVIRMEAGSRLELPPTQPGTHRNLYLFEGQAVRAGGHEVRAPVGLELRGPAGLVVENGDAPAELLLLQGRPIAEPVAHHGPFVMNTRQELVAAFRDYEHTRFGGWPWPSAEPVHPREEGRFAQHPDGRVEVPS